jgi:hypothetical protein
VICNRKLLRPWWSSPRLGKGLDRSRERVGWVSYSSVASRSARGTERALIPFLQFGTYHRSSRLLSAPVNVQRWRRQWDGLPMQGSCVHWIPNMVTFCRNLGISSWIWRRFGGNVALCLRGWRINCARKRLEAGDRWPWRWRRNVPPKRRFTFNTVLCPRNHHSLLCFVTQCVFSYISGMKTLNNCAPRNLSSHFNVSPFRNLCLRTKNILFRFLIFKITF